MSRSRTLAVDVAADVIASRVTTSSDSTALVLATTALAGPTPQVQVTLATPIDTVDVREVLALAFSEFSVTVDRVSTADPRGSIVVTVRRDLFIDDGVVVEPALRIVVSALRWLADHLPPSDFA